MSPDKSDQLANIELLRGLAALLVVAVHSRLIFWVGMHRFWELYGPSFGLTQAFAYLSFPLAWGTIGVPLFFVISGYVIHRKPAQLIAAGRSDAFSTRAFLRRRFFKIYPTLLAALIATVLLDQASNQFVPPYHVLRGATENHGWATFIGNLFATQGIWVSTLGSNGALWTLALEIQFYALYPLLYALRTRIGLRGSLGAVALINVLSYLAFQRHDITVFGSYYLSWFLGAFIADREAHGTQWLDGRRAAALAAVFFVAGCAALSRSSYAAFQLWAITAAGAVIATRPARLDRAPIARALRSVGEFSYSLYAIHVPLLTFFACWLYGYEKQVSIMPAIWMVAVCVPFGWAFYRLIERPSSRWGQRRVPRTPAAAA